MLLTCQNSTKKDLWKQPNFVGNKICVPLEKLSSLSFMLKLFLLHGTMDHSEMKTNFFCLSNARHHLTFPHIIVETIDIALSHGQLGHWSTTGVSGSDLS